MAVFNCYLVNGVGNVMHCELTGFSPAAIAQLQEWKKHSQGGSVWTAEKGTENFYVLGQVTWQSRSTGIPDEVRLAKLVDGVEEFAMKDISTLIHRTDHIAKVDNSDFFD